MPELSRFLGIVITMVYDDHAPPHFHAQYGDHEISVEIETGTIIGQFPRRALAAVQEWRNLHKDELKIDWKAAMEHDELKKIAPLE